jgi:hypothetical protein
MGITIPTLQVLAPLVVSILQALVPFAWVCFAFTVLFMFKTQIKQILNRLEEGEFFGQRIKLGKDLDRLEASSSSLNQEAQVSLPKESQVDNAGQERFDSATRSILQEAANSPKVALMMLSAELERVALEGLATRGLLRNRLFIPLRQSFEELRQYGLPANLVGSLELFSSIRNKIVHGRAATDDDALRALDSGMTILRALNSLPNEVNIIYHPGVKIFSDADCTTAYPNVLGVILETISPGGAIREKRIFPTTRTHFKKGKQVAFEWNNSKQWPKAWYLDPDTNEKKFAWDTSAEFVGWHLEDLVGTVKPESVEHLSKD